MARPEANPEPTDLAADWPGALLIAGGITCLLDLLTVLGRGLLPVWSISPLLPVVFFIVALMAFYRHRWVRLYRPYGGRLSIYLAELIVLILLTRFVPLLADPARLLASLPAWWADPTTFFDARFVVDAVFVGAAWALGHSLGAAVDQIHLQPGELPPPRGQLEAEPGAAATAAAGEQAATRWARMDTDMWERSAAAFDHRGAYRQITNHVIGGGAVAVLVLAMIGLAPSAAPLLPEAVVAAGLYLVCGALLMGWAHVTLLDTLWRIDGLAAPSALRQRWPGWLALILVVVAVLALVAPRSYAFDPLALLIWVVYVVVGLIQILMFLIALPFLWLASLLFGSGSPGTPRGLPAMPGGEAGPSGGEWELLPLLRSLGFWLITIALAVYAVRSLYQSRWGAMRLLPRLAPWAVLVRWWRAVLGGLRDRAATLVAALRPGSDARAAMSAALRRPAHRPRPSDPRGLIQFLYLSLVERAGRRGFPRRRGMTAAEYSRYLATRLAAIETAGPEGPADPAAARADLDALTAAFLEARYSRHPVGEPEASLARRALERLLRVIRRKQ